MEFTALDSANNIMTCKGIFGFAEKYMNIGISANMKPFYF